MNLETRCRVSCNDVADFLMDYLDGTLPFAQRMTFKLHLSLCPDCRRYIDSYKKTIQISRLAHTSPELSNPPEDLIQAILKSKP
jgi:predicted anti-sigma-YlaC factor YlaD